MHDTEQNPAGPILDSVPENGAAASASTAVAAQRNTASEVNDRLEAGLPAPAARSPRPESALGRARRRTVFTVLGFFVLFFGGWWLVDEFVAYTDDAYVTSEVIAVAPEVTGPIVAVHVRDNQTVKLGDPLVSIDPQPFQIALDRAHAELLQAQAQLPIDQAQLDVAQDQMKSSQNDLNLANIELQRIRKLTAASVTDQQSLDVATARARDATARMDAANATLAQCRGMLHLHERAVDTARAVVATAQWRFDRTEIRAAADGPVSNLTVRVGTMAVEHAPILTIVDAHAWHIEANYKERFLRHFRPGMTAWVWLDADPGHWYRAQIQGISHVINRRETAAGLVPYVSPTVDWIRLTRRIPVRIELVDPPSDVDLFMGSDARTVVFY